MNHFLKSSLGLKYIMAITGFACIGFILVHMLGNLQIFSGPEAINAYGAALQHLGKILWVARITIVSLFLLHIFVSIRLKFMNGAARPNGYSFSNTVKATITSRTMIYSGIMIFCFVTFHILHFTLNQIDPSFTHMTDAQGRHDVYRMLITGFSNPYAAGIYVIAILLLAGHVHHAASSMFQSLGVNNKKYSAITAVVGPALAVIVGIGYCSIPISVFLGWIH